MTIMAQLFFANNAAAVGRHYHADHLYPVTLAVFAYDVGHF